jgi:hypothetical protein
MFTLNKKRKMLITSTMALAFVFIVSLPYAYASSPSATTAETQASQTRVSNAKGIAVEKSENQRVIASAGFSLALETTEVNETTTKFNVISGTVKINRTEHTITGGNGAVIRDKHGSLLQAQGTSPDGQSGTLKLAGRYFWIWGRLYIARVLGSLQTESAKICLLLRSVIRV